MKPKTRLSHLKKGDRFRIIFNSKYHNGTHFKEGYLLRPVYTYSCKEKSTHVYHAYNALSGLPTFSSKNHFIKIEP